MPHAAEVARRMGLPDDAYDMVVQDSARAALDYSDTTPDVPELFVCFGTQFESNMMERARWVKKLKDRNTKLIVVDPIPDPFTVEHADLIIPAPVHPATAKVYQNGEWKISLSIPQKQRPKDTRSDTTIIYDVMAEITDRISNEPELAAANPDLARHAKSGYLQTRFGPATSSPAITGPFSRSFSSKGLIRVEGEASRPQLWNRIQQYMSGGTGPLYCRPEHEDGRPISWDDLLREGAIVYGGVGNSPLSPRLRRPRSFPICRRFSKQTTVYLFHAYQRRPSFSLWRHLELRSISVIRMNEIGFVLRSVHSTREKRLPLLECLMKIH